MKILMTLMGLEIGGAETHVVELAKELHTQGHTILVASNGGVYESALAELGIRHIKIPMHQRVLGNMLRSLKLLKKLITEEKPDLVHAHARIPAFLCGILHRQMGFPFITSAHGVFEVTPLLRTVTDWGQRTVAVSEDIRSYLMCNYQIPPDRIHSTVNGIDTALFSPGPSDRSLAESLGIRGEPVIGTVGRLDHPQELAAKELIESMPEILRSFPKAQLLVVGSGDQEEVLRKRAAQINGQTGTNTIIMTGPRTDIAQLMRLIDLFVGVSRAALEAMSEEKATILAGGQGYIGLFTADVLALARKSNFCGRGCPQINREVLLADLLSALKMDPEQRQELGRFGRMVVQEEYSVAKMTKDYLQAYEALLHPTPVIRAAISGYYGFDNLGDDAILHAISGQLSGLQKPVRLTVLSKQPQNTIRQYGLLAVPRFSPIKLYRTLKHSDLLISGGGSLLQNKTSTRSLMYYLSVIRLAKWLKKPVFLYANGIGPLIGESNRRKVKRCIDQCDFVTLRDTESLDELRALGVTRGDIPVTGDPAFTLKPAEGRRTQLRALGIPDDASVVGISVRNIPDATGFPEQFAALCDRLVREQGKTIVFLVMQESADEPVSRRIQSLMRENSYIAKTPGDPGAMLALIRDMDVLISMRLHTIIFAATVNVPVVGCVYDPKVSAFLHMLDMPSCGTPQDMDADSAYKATLGILENQAQIRARLAGRVAQLTPQAEQTALLLEEMLRKHNLL